MSSLPWQIPLFEPDTDPAAAPPRVRPPRLKKPALRLCVLGSGSGGNCSVLQRGGDVLLIDAGFGPHTTRRRLAQAGLGLEQVAGVCLTHLDQDHFRRSWPATLRKHAIPVHLHRWHLDELLALPGGRSLHDDGLVRVFDEAPFEPLPGLLASTCRCQHDLQGTIGYRFDCEMGAVGYATDLGHVPPALIDHFAGVDLLALECNYDEHMTIHSPRPTFVNRRNMSDSGHLSNEQAYDAVRQIAAASPPGNPRQVVLLHRSSQCNHPMKIKRVFERDANLARRVALTDQRRRTRWLTVRRTPPIARAQLRWRF